jgi:hypothetical protein
MLFRKVSIVAMVVLPLTCAQPVWGQEATSDTTPPDTTIVSRFNFVPTFTAKSRADVSSVMLGGAFNHTFRMRNGFRLMTIFETAKEEFRLQARSNDTKRFSNTLSHQLGRGWMVDLDQNDSRTFNRVVSLQGGFQDVILNTFTVGGGLRHVTIMPRNLRWDVRLDGALADAEKTFKTDKSAGGEVGGGVGYSLLNRWLVVRGRAYRKHLDINSYAPGEVFDGLFLKEDSLSAAAVVNFTDEQIVTFDYQVFDSEERYTDQKRGSTGIQKVGAENLFTERRTVESRVARMAFSSDMLHGLGLRIDARHSENITDYDSTKTRFSRNITNELGSDITYNLGRNTIVTAKLQSRKSLKDLGRESLSSYDQRNRKAELGLQHIFGNNSSVHITGTLDLAQYFYLRYDQNPRDRDQLDQRLNVRFTSYLHKKLGVVVSAVFLQTDFVNIDKTLSNSNRVMTRYDFRPVLTYKLTERLTVAQAYGLAIEFTDHNFVPEDNFLDRNITFSNDVTAELTQRLSGNFYYAYHFHDRGSYLAEEKGGERFLNIDREDRRDQIKLAFTYRLTGKVSVVGRQDYSRREDRVAGQDRVRVNEDGGIEMGLRGDFAWTADQTLTFTVMKANRFGAFSTEAQKDFWIVNAQFKYVF